MNNGLYFYKLVSPYSEDITKDCKLTINEIDSNFLTLKEADIADVVFDKETQVLTLKKVGGSVLETKLDGLTTNFDVEFDSEAGVINFYFNGEKIAVNGLLTNDNYKAKDEIFVTSDSSLTGYGNKKSPLMLAHTERTGVFSPVKKMIDITIGEKLPSSDFINKGDRYLTHEEISKFGYLYNYRGLAKIEADLKNGWRIPTKADWDAMLNSVEPCDANKNHDNAVTNAMLGKYAGKILKSTTDWLLVPMKNSLHNCLNKDCECGDDCDCPTSSLINCDTLVQNGIDGYGMGITCAGFNDGNDVTAYYRKRGYYWTKDKITETDVYVKRFDYDKEGVIQTVESPSSYFSIRLVKDYDGFNHEDVEEINGLNYHTVLLPNDTADSGFSIWTSDNVYFNDVKYCFKEPNNGFNLNKVDKYYINEWTGTKWEKKELQEGEGLVIINGLEGKKGLLYRVIDGKLMTEEEIIAQLVLGDVTPELEKMKKIMGEQVIESTPIYMLNDEGEVIKDAYGNPVIIGYTEKPISFSEKISKMDALIGDGMVGDTITNYLKKTIQDLGDEVSARAELQASFEEEVETRTQNELVITDRLDTLEDEVTELSETVARHEESVSTKEERFETLFAEDEYIKSRLLKLEQSEGKFDVINGTLTLEAENADNNIVIKLSSDHGTIEDFINMHKN